MDWQQKFAAIQAFAGNYETALHMRKPGNWYVRAGMTIGGDGMLSGRYGNGATPEEAVADHWRIYVEELLPTRYAVAGRGENERRGRWNGFMWEILTTEQVEAIRGDSRAVSAK